tara:strand:+ start:84 stop:296 length:213 start_codon:yes stop_codon:yes gene_type:complete
MPRVLKVAVITFIGTIAVGMILQLVLGIPQQFVLIGDKLVNINVVKPTIVRLHPLYNKQAMKLSLTRNII